MAEKRQDTPTTGKARPASRDARLGAALRANLARRKARARALGDQPPPQPQGSDAPQDHSQKD